VAHGRRRLSRLDDELGAGLGGFGTDDGVVVVQIVDDGLAHHLGQHVRREVKGAQRPQRQRNQLRFSVLLDVVHLSQAAVKVVAARLRQNKWGSEKCREESQRKSFSFETIRKAAAAAASAAAACVCVCACACVCVFVCFVWVVTD
jgi:hypothetical protein